MGQPSWYALIAYARTLRNNFLLGGAASAQHRRNRPQQYLEIQPRRPVVDVLQVELHPAVEVDLVAAAHLPEAREAGLHRQPAAVPAVVRGHLLGDGGAGADQAHVALQHVQELRQLVERELPEDTADRGDARVVLRL